MNSESPRRPVKRDPGVVLLMGGHADMALPLLLQTMKQNPNEWGAWSNLGVAYRQMGKYEDARKAFEQALKLGLHNFEVWHNLSSVHTELGDFDRAYDCLCGASKLSPNHPEVALAMSHALIRRGEWERAWPLWELGRWNESWIPIPDIPIWSGESVKGKRILVLCEGGYGDTILFMRWFPLLQDAGAQVDYLVWDKQVPLIDGHPWINKTLPLSKPFDARGYDYQTALMSIPGWLHATPDKIPSTEDGYLWGDPQRVGYSRGRKPLVGLCWYAEESGVPRKVRTIPIEALEPLKDLPVEFVSLSPGVEAPKWVTQFRPGDWADTASMMTHMDAIITCDTAIGHLGGAMNKETYIILPPGSGWMWFTGTDRSPFYSSVRLIRSMFPERWEASIEEVKGRVRFPVEAS